MRFQLAANDDHTDLHSYIESALTTRMFGSKAFKYLRAAEIRELTSDHNIDIVVKCGTLRFLPGHAKEELGKQARSTARILFLITVAADLPMSNLCLLLLHRGLNDQNLPITNVTYDALEERVKLKEFQALQHLIPPVLKESTFLTSGVDSTLPIEIKSVFAPGTTRRMYRAYMDTEYYKIRTLEQQADDPSLSRMLAVIEINTATPEQESRARSKIEFAQFLADRVHHEHIARSFGTFALSYMFPGETTQYLIAERPVGNLKYYILKRDPQTHHHKKHPALPTDYWLRKQVCGLAKALADIHTPTNGRFGIHHDIRPENILLFEETGQAFTLKFGGSGLAKVHARELEEHQHTSATLGVTMSPYLPPEASNGQPLFRAHDIWSLGCVFLELLMWYTEGQAAYRSFVTAACGKDRTQCWFLVENERIFLQPIIRNQLDALEAVQQGKWAGLACMIRRMLTIDASSRIEAGELSSALYTLLKPRVGSIKFFLC